MVERAAMGMNQTRLNWCDLIGRPRVKCGS
jgi:hypothetical protein